MSSATDELRRLLDERGVWHEGGERSLRWRDRYGVMMQAFPLANGELGMGVWSCTPEQAIAATLSDVPRLPYFWTADDMLHIELPRLPESISVRLPDQRDREVGSARTWQYMRDNGTCKEVKFDRHFRGCSECGYRWEHMYAVGWQGGPKFCPNCGRKVVDE